MTLIHVTDNLARIVKCVRREKLSPYRFGPQGNVARWLHHIRCFLPSSVARCTAFRTFHLTWPRRALINSKTARYENLYFTRGGQWRHSHSTGSSWNTSGDFIVATMIASSRWGAHACVVLIDNEAKTMEMFDPQAVDYAGNLPPDGAVLIDNCLHRVAKDKGLSYQGPFEASTQVSPQFRIQNALPESGFCTAISLIFAHLKICTPSASSSQILGAINSMRTSDLIDLVRRYTSWVARILPFTKPHFNKIRGDHLL